MLPKPSILIIDATVHYFGGGTGSVYNMSCQTSETDPSDCNLIITPSSCHHSMDVGVKCLAFADACAVSVIATGGILGASCSSGGCHWMDCACRVFTYRGK